MIVLCLLLAEAAIIAYAGTRPTAQAILGAGVFSNMAMIALFAPYLINVMGITTNLGTVFYAGVVASQCIVIERFGPFVARDALSMTYIRLITVFAACTIIGLLPILPGNEDFALAAKTVSRFQVMIVMASFAAFALSQLVLIMSYPRLRTAFGPLGAMLLGMVACQAIDSPVFYTVAFPKDPQILHFIIGGFLAKVAFGFVLAPVVWGAVLYSKRRPSSKLDARVSEIMLRVAVGD